MFAFYFMETRSIKANLILTLSRHFYWLQVVSFYVLRLENLPPVR
jgi:hypothetical protein